MDVSHTNGIDILDRPDFWTFAWGRHNPARHRHGAAPAMGKCPRGTVAWLGVNLVVDCWANLALPGGLGA
jgi:hypothetical protein